MNIVLIQQVNLRVHTEFGVSRIFFIFRGELGELSESEFIYISLETGFIKTKSRGFREKLKMFFLNFEFSHLKYNQLYASILKRKIKVLRISQRDLKIFNLITSMKQ